MKQPDSRIQALDALRGFALFGILVINVQLFSGWAYLGAEERAVLAGDFDTLLKPVTDILAQGKFYSLFALMFGYSFVMLAMRTQADPAELHLRRMLGLLILGLAHSAFLWPWDILHLYAAVGMLLTPFLLRQPRTLLLWAAALFLVIGTLRWSWILSELPVPWDELRGLKVHQNVPRLADGSYFEVVQANVDLAFATLLGRVETLRPLRVLALFLIGAAAARWRLAESHHAHVGTLRRFALVVTPLALVLSMADKILAPQGSLQLALVIVADTLAAPLLAMTYAALLLLWWRGDSTIGRAIRNALAPAGRMALTNYLLQSVVCVVVFYGFGAGLFATRSFTWILGFAIGLFLLQLLLSRLWLNRFRQGPFEWLWRWQVHRALPPRFAA